MAARGSKGAKTPKYFSIPCFPIPIFGGKVLLCCDRDEWASVAEEYEGDPDSELCKGLSIRYLRPSEGRTYVMGVFDSAIDTFTHELAHIVFFLLHDVGIALEDGGANENFAYLQGFLMREILPSFLARIES